MFAPAVTRVQKIILTIGVIVALALAGMAAAASQAKPTITSGKVPGVRLGPHHHREAPLQDTTAWWIFGVGAVVVLTGLGLVLARPSVPRSS